MNSSVRKSSAGNSGHFMSGAGWTALIAILVLGIFLGYLLSRTASRSSSRSVNHRAQSNGGTPSPQSQASFAAGMQPLLARLKSDPNDPALLAEVGNRYFDHQEWSNAVRYYRLSLQLQPANVDVRTDMGTAIWYGGDPWDAVKEYKTALSYQPNYGQTLFNMGIVQWQGLHDDRAALKTWQELLTADPDYSDRAKVEQYMQTVQAELNQRGAPSGNQ